MNDIQLALQAGEIATKSDIADGLSRVQSHNLVMARSSWFRLIATEFWMTESALGGLSCPLLSKLSRKWRNDDT